MTTRLGLPSLLLWVLAACVQGPGGDKGAQGDAGRVGADGADGADGATGLDGADGADGSAGSDGADGLDGSNGADGADGADGVDGEDGLDGTDGVDGSDGADGADGVDGRDGHDGDAPWGVVLTIDAVDGGSGPDGQLVAGDIPTIWFTVQDDAGVPYDVATMDGLSFQVAGPTYHRQVLIDASSLTDTQTAPVYVGDGQWRYTLPVAVPEVYAPVANDSPTLGVDAGDWGGTPVESGTYTVAGWAWMTVTRGDASTWDDGGGGALDVLVGDVDVVEPRALVDDTTCRACHGEDFSAHGGSRREVAICGVCHVAGAEDRAASDDPTPGVTIDGSVMMHQLHAGASLETPLVLAGEATEGDVGYTLHDYGAVGFPAWPMGVATCAACHVDAGPPTRAGCGSCHTGVDWASGSGHTGGAMTDDDTCADCHADTDVAGYHADPRTIDTLDRGLVVTVDAVTGGTGSAGQLLPGDTVTVRFRVTDSGGTAWPSSALDAVTVAIAGPLDHMQTVVADTAAGEGSSTVTLVEDGSGTLAVVLVLPEVYAAQMNDTPDVGEMDGDWGGLPLVSGTYRVVVGGLRSFLDADGAAVSVPASDGATVLVGEESTSLDTRAVVDESACEACHGAVVGHGDTRAGLDLCTTCHTAGAEDFGSTDTPEVTPGVTVDWPVLIHKIHNGRALSAAWSVVAADDALRDYAMVVFPRMDGAAAACVACHAGAEAAEVPSTRMCATCHDAEADALHFAANTDDTWGESCTVCHGAGSAWDVATSHDVTR